MFFSIVSGSDVHITPHLHASLERERFSNKRTFDNKPQLQATVNGVIKLIVQEKEKAV